MTYSIKLDSGVQYNDLIFVYIFEIITAINLVNIHLFFSLSNRLSLSVCLFLTTFLLVFLHQSVSIMSVCSFSISLPFPTVPVSSPLPVSFSAFLSVSCLPRTPSFSLFFSPPALEHLSLCSLSWLFFYLSIYFFVLLSF